MSFTPNDIWLLGGQGSQYFQMGRSNYEQDPRVRYWMNRLDHLYKVNTGRSVLSELYFAEKTRLAPFTDLSITHPAIFMLQYALCRSMLEEGKRPAFLVGYSLGELVALTVAESIDYNTAIVLLQKEAEEIEKACAPATMMAVLMSPVDYYSSPWLYNASALVSGEGPSQIVITLLKSNEAAVERRLREEGLVFLKLPIDYGFHAPYIDRAKHQLLAHYDTIELKAPRWPIFSCRTQAFLNWKETSSTEILWERIRGKFSIYQSLEKLGRDYDDHGFKDISPNALYHNQILKMKREGKVAGNIQTTFTLSPFKTLEKSIHL